MNNKVQVLLSLLIIILTMFVLQLESDLANIKTYPSETITINPWVNNCPAEVKELYKDCGFSHKLCYSEYFCISWNSLPSPVYNNLTKQLNHKHKG